MFSRLVGARMNFFFLLCFFFSKGRKEIRYIVMEIAVLMPALGVGDARTPRPQWYHTHMYQGSDAQAII